MMIVNADRFFGYAQERYSIMLKRERGDPWPWTDDPVLQKGRFTNVFREDDTVTRVIRDLVRDPHDAAQSDNMVQAVTIARWFNRERTVAELVKNDLLDRWDSDVARKTLAHVKPLVTGAFIIKTPTVKNKLEGMIECVERFVPNALEIQEYIAQPGRTLQEATERLAKEYSMGPFMAYEVVTDLRHTWLLRDAPDILTWANPGPGAARGLCRLCDLPLDAFDRGKKDHVRKMTNLMRILLLQSRAPHNWPRNWPRWEMREVEHTLCEWDKYERMRLGEGRTKQLFRWPK